MALLTQLPLDQARAPWKQRVKKILLSHWTFVVLQLLDLVTTLVAFRAGGLEANPLVAHLTVRFGNFNGVLISKLIALAIALGVSKRLWIINLFYAAIICWNALVLVGLRSH